MNQVIAVRHNVEMAHRLSQTPGKCENIHGHSWNVILKLYGEVDETGKVAEFGGVKKMFRGYLDENFDHRILLWYSDPILMEIGPEHRPEMVWPGIKKFNEDPTTENFAAHLLAWSVETFELRSEVEVWETAVNMARAGGPPL